MGQYPSFRGRLTLEYVGAQLLVKVPEGLVRTLPVSDPVQNISKSWVYTTLGSPDKIESHDDGSVHYIKIIEEFGNRHLRVIVNPAVQPNKIVTQFFDRRLRSSS